jgi:glycosyltransferase involved in cell wall biosynthesis
MKILMLVPFLPNDQMSGGQTRWYNMIKHLSKDHQITLMSLVKDDWEKKFIPELERYCKKVMVFKRPKSPWTLRNLFLTFITFNPLVVIRNLSLEERSAIKRELAENNYDLIHAETFYVMPHIPKTKTPIVLVEPTIEFSVYQHYVDQEVLFLLKPFYLFDVVKLRFWEKYYWKKASRLFAVSEDDKKVMQKEIPGIKVGVLPNGIDSDYFNEKKTTKITVPTILYVGNYKWMQNIEAVNILIRDIWPKIKEKVQNCRLWIVGVNMPPQIIDYSKNNTDIRVSEGLPDIREAYKSSSVLVAPIKGPGGTRLKVLEAMASGLPVVSTSVGVAGLGITPGREALISETTAGLTNLAIKVLKNEKLAVRIGEQGRKFVQGSYDWNSIAGKLNKVYEETRTIGNNS